MHVVERLRVWGGRRESVGALRAPRWQILQLKRFWTILLVPLSYLMVAIAGAWPTLTEQVYSRIFYPAMRAVIGGLTSLAPISVAEILLILLPLAFVTYLVPHIALAVRYKYYRRYSIARMAATAICIGSVGLFVFQAVCGLNYHRESFAVHSGLHVRPSSVDELEALCTDLLENANILRVTLSEDENGVMTSSFDSYYELAAFAGDAYTVIARDHPTLGGYTVRPKPVNLSRGMSYMDITGVYMPFTFEANVNVDIPAYWIPSTMLHEVAHSKGYMREDEANFIAYITAKASGNDEFAYSASVLALIHSTNALYSVDTDRYWALREQYCDGLNRDLAANSEYWRQFEGPVATASVAVNNAYLRSNRQTDGVRSYGRMVDLLLAEHRAEA